MQFFKICYPFLLDDASFPYCYIIFIYFCFNIFLLIMAMNIMSNIEKFTGTTVIILEQGIVAKSGNIPQTSAGIFLLPPGKLGLRD